MKRVRILALLLVVALVACGAASWEEHYDLGMKLLNEGKYEEAILEFDKAIEIDDKQAKVYVGRGQAYAGTGDDENLETAISDYEKAITLDESYTDAYIGMADVYIMQGDYNKAKEALERGIKATDDDKLKDKLAEVEEKLKENDKSTFSATLSLSDFRYEYEAGGDIIERNEGAVGGMNLSATVNGPENVMEVRIAGWQENPYDEEKINNNINSLVAIWKEAGGISSTQRATEMVLTHPVGPKELGKKMYVILVGLDENCDAVGYAVVEEVIG